MRSFLISLLIGGFAFASPSSNRYIPGQFLKNGPGVFAIPSVSTNDQLVGRATTDTLTNKSIDGATNTVTGLTTSSISSSAAIDFTKLHNLTSAHLLIGSGSNIPTDTAVSGAIGITNAGVTSYVGVVPIAQGGTNNGSLAVTAGGVFYADGSKMVALGAGTTGQFLMGGATAPTWANVTMTKQIFTSTGSQTGMMFTFSTASFAIGDIYFDTGSHFYVALNTCTNCTLGYFSGVGVFAGGNLTKSVGSGSASLTVSANQTMGTYTPGANARLLKIIVSSGGGSGGGTASVTSDSGAASGGDGGGTAVKYISSPAGSYYYSVGASASGGSAGNNGGNQGGNSDFNLGSINCAGGAGGTGSAGTATTVTVNDASGSVGTCTGGDANLPGQKAGYGLTISGSSAISGYGGGSYWGAGAGQVVNATGANAANYGSGGSGGCQVSNSGTKGGGSGAAGVLWIEEYQ